MQQNFALEDERSAVLLSDFFDNAAVGLRWQGPDGVVQRVNHAELELLGYARDEYVGKSARTFFADPEVADDIQQRLALGETLHSVEAQLLSRSGSIKHVLVSANVLWQEGKFIHARVLTRDITRQKHAQFALQEADQRKAAILNASLDAIITMDQDGMLVDFNPAAEQIFGYPRAEAIGRQLADLIIPMHLRAQHREGLRRFLSTGEAHVLGKRIEISALHASGREFPIELSITVVDVRPMLFTATLRDITLSKKANQDLKQALSLLEATFAHAAAGIVLTPPEGTLLQANQKFTDITGYDAAELSKLTLIGITHPADRAASAVHMEQLREGTLDHFTVEKRYVHKSGQTVWGKTSVGAIRDASGSLLRFIAVVDDITAQKGTELALQRSESRLRTMLEERKQLLDSERAARTAAERLSELKDQFLATLSHELRTPLSAILGWTSILRRKSSPEDVQKGMEIIERNARLQAQLIEELLDTSRITTGKVALDLQPVDAANVVRSAADSARPMAAAKGVELRVVAAQAGAVVQADPHRLQQVVSNLMTNAVKFTDKGGIITVSVHQDEDAVEIAVADTGEGMSPEFLEHAFDRFRQADASTTRKYGGLGLGLAIVRSLVELHGGTVTATSPGKGKGAHFRVRLPVSQPGSVSQDQSAPLRAASATIDLHGFKVLVVDDEPDAREVLERVLCGCGATVFLASSAGQALELLQAQRPDALVSDIGMPDEDGYDLIRRVRALSPDEGGTTPAIALTAFARTEDHQKSLRAGFRRHLNKPIEPLEVVAELQAIKDGRSASPALP